MRLSAIAKTYAKALYQAATDANQVEQVMNSLKALSEFILENKLFSNAICSEAFSISEKEKLAVEFNKLTKPQPLVAKLFEILVLKGRAKLIGQVYEAAQLEHDDIKGIVRGTVTSVGLLSESEKNDLGRAFSNKLGKQVILEQEQDSSILGGLIVNIKGKRFDGSLKTAMHNLKTSLEKN